MATPSAGARTGFRKNFRAHEPHGRRGTLSILAWNFAELNQHLLRRKINLPPRAQPHNYMQEIYTAWIKTAEGYSGDIAIP